MPTLANTTLEDLEPRLVEVIEAISPRVRTQQTATWKYYPKGQVSPGRTRSFTLRWDPGRFQTRGWFTNQNMEQLALLRVRTDYVGQHETLMWLVQNDYAQLRDRLNVLTADLSSGLGSIEPTAGPARVADTDQGRQALSGAAAFNSDSFQIDHTYAVTFVIAKATG